jgi:hypothetical protein
MTVAYVNKYLGDWLKAQESKGSVTEVRRELVDLRENIKPRADTY